MVERFGEYILQQYVSFRAVPEFNVREAGGWGGAVEFFRQTSSPVCIPEARQR